MNRWKEYFEKLLNVKYERQMRDDDEDDIKERKEEITDEGIRIEEVIEAIYMLKRGKAEHDNITTEMLQKMGKIDLKC